MENNEGEIYADVFIRKLCFARADFVCILGISKAGKVSRLTIIFLVVRFYIVSM